MQSQPDELRARCEAAGQGHVFAFWDELDERQRAQLCAQVASIDFDLTRELAAQLNAAPPQGGANFEPADVFPLRRDAARAQEAQQASAQGEELLRAGAVGFVLVAGGQGSRLGFDGPKGKFPVGPVSGCSLFEWHARRLLAARERYGTDIAWYVMTSQTNHAETQSYFEERDWFGLDPAGVRLFQQDMLPAFDLDGRFLMSSKDSLFLAPNGHGGTLAALRSAGCLDDARERGIDFFSYFQVDNPLARPADPLFLGLAALEGAAMSSKVVRKRDAGEKVGVIGRVDGALGCIEYSDLSDELRNARDADGELLFGAGNIAAHVLERRFVEELTAGGLKLPWHLARKKMQVVQSDGSLGERDGVKFESFVFDALGRAERSVTLEVDRSLEFSPVKNREGEDSPATTRRDLTRMFASWLEAAELELPAPADDGSYPLEVDPRVAEDAHGFREGMPHSPSEHAGGRLFQR